ncbi:MAG: response regulator, partial [Elusimicrobia bacterium]|nr:response regulator [Elusimicrobiota bacterium]
MKESGEIRRQVLVAGADLYFQKVLVQLLEVHGFDTLTASSSQGVIQKAETLDIDLIILGEDFSGHQGFDVCRQLKSSGKTETIPVVIVTSTSDAENRVRGYHSGADDCVSKNFEKEELLARMEALWRRKNGTFKAHQEDRRKKILDELTRIIDQGLIEPHFQPIYYLQPFRLFGMEVLSRPRGATFLSNPEELFKTALKYDLYYPLELLCWRKALSVISSRTKTDHIFFNCSPHIIENKDFSSVRAIFEESRIPLGNIVLEITE